MTIEEIEALRDTYREAFKNGTKGEHGYVVFTPNTPNGNKQYILTKTTKWEFIFLSNGRVILINLDDDKKFNEKVEEYCTKLFGDGKFDYYV